MFHGGEPGGDPAERRTTSPTIQRCWSECLSSAFSNSNSECTNRCSALLCLFGCYNWLQEMKLLSFLRSPKSGRHKIDDYGSSSFVTNEGMGRQAGTSKVLKSSNNRRTKVEDNRSSLSSLYLSEDGTDEIQAVTSQYRDNLGAQPRIDSSLSADQDTMEENRALRPDSDSTAVPNFTSGDLIADFNEEMWEDEAQPRDSDSHDELGVLVQTNSAEEKLGSCSDSSSLRKAYSFEECTTEANDLGFDIDTAKLLKRAHSFEFSLERSLDENIGSVDPCFCTNRSKDDADSQIQKMSSKGENTSLPETVPAPVDKSCTSGFVNACKSLAYSLDTSADVENSECPTAISSSDGDHWKFLDTEQPSNPDSIVSSPLALARHDSLSENEINKPLHEEESNEDSESDGFGDLKRAPPSQPWRFRTDLVIMVLMAAMLLAIAVAVVSAFAVNDNNRTISSAGSERTAGTPDDEGNVPSLAPSNPSSDQTWTPTTSPDTTDSPPPTTSCVSPAIAIRPFLVELTTTSEFRDFDTEISEIIDITTEWIEDSVRNAAPACYGSTDTVGYSRWAKANDDSTFTGTVQYRTCVVLEGSSCPDEEYLWKIVSDSFSTRRRRIRKLEGSLTYLQFLRDNLPTNNPFRDSVGVSVITSTSVPSVTKASSDQPTWAPSSLLSSTEPSVSYSPSLLNSDVPTLTLSGQPVPKILNGQALQPSVQPSQATSSAQSDQPSLGPVELPAGATASPSGLASSAPEGRPSAAPSEEMSSLPTGMPSMRPSAAPPSRTETLIPSSIPFATHNPSLDHALCRNSPGCKALDLVGQCCPTINGVFLYCCDRQSQTPTIAPTREVPSSTPTETASFAPSSGLSQFGSLALSFAASVSPTATPTSLPTDQPTKSPSTPPMSQVPSKSPSKSPLPPVHLVRTPSPTQFDRMQLIVEASPTSTKAALNDPNSAQSQALHHLMNTTIYNTNMDWQTGVIQKFALLSFSFTTIQSGGHQRSLTSSSKTERSHRLSGMSWPQEGPDECGWVGVFCDVSQRVVAINVAQRGLPGQLVPEWAMLKDSLQLIDATDNELTGEIPSEFGDLHLLRWLRLSRNRLTGNIPDSLFRLQSLMQLDVFRNELNGDFPNAVLSQMTGLMTVRLYFNKFTGRIDTSVCDLGLSVFEADCYLGGDCVLPCWYI